MWPFSKKKNLNSKPICMHDWIKDKQSLYTVTSNTSRFHICHHIPIDVKYNESWMADILIKSGYFDKQYIKYTNLVRILPAEVFDAVCRNCDEINLGYTRCLDQTDELIKKLLEEAAAAKLRLDKYRTIMKKAK